MMAAGLSAAGKTNYMKTETMTGHTIDFDKLTIDDLRFRRDLALQNTHWGIAEACIQTLDKSADDLLKQRDALRECLQIMLDAFNVETIDPLAAFVSIEKAKAALEASHD